MRLGWSTSKISRVENGLIGITEVDVVRYAAHCGVPAHGIDALLEMCREPGAQGYWLSKWSSTLIFHESAAAFSSSYNPLVVPGLLQTRDYAAALISTEGLEPGLAQHRMNARMERQRVLRRRPFEFFVHEQALRLRVGGDRVMNEQMLNLALLCGQPGITLRVVPASLGERSVFGGTFVHFRYSGHKPLIYLENPRPEDDSPAAPLNLAEQALEIGV